MRRLLATVALALVTATATAQTPSVRHLAGFDGEAALRHVERVVAIGPRPAGSPAAARTRDYIVAELKKAGARVRVEPFEASTPDGRLKMANLVAVVPGRRADVIMIGGHYDTKWFPDIHFVGANDGGSSTGFLIELTRRLVARGGEFTYWIAFFDGEEARRSWTATDSLYGSRHLAAELKRKAQLPRAVVVVDMIGDRNLGIRREAYSAAPLTELIWASALRLGHGQHFLSEAMAVEDDHAPFLRAGVPSVLLIDFDFPPWHTSADTLDTISAQSLQVVGDVLLDALPSLEAWLLRTRGGPRP